MKRKKLIVCALSALLSLTLTAEIRFSDQEWNFGILTSQSQIVSRDFTAQNTGSQAVTVKVIPTCDCLAAAPPEATIGPSDIGFFRLIYDPFEDSGEVERYYMIYTDTADFEPLPFKVYGVVDLTNPSQQPAQESSAGPETAPDADISLLYYYMPNCPECRKFINEELPALEKKLQLTINLVNKSIAEPEPLKECLARLKQLDIKQEAFPVLFIGDKVLQGNAQIGKNLEQEIAYALAHNVDTEIGKPVTDENIELQRNLTILPVFAAGLIDGINPCAFATIIMLLSSLALAGKRRREILIMGLFFTLSVFITYYAVGVGIFTAIQAASTFPLIAAIIRWVLFGGLLLLAGLSVYDYFKIKAGKQEEMLLQLSDVFKKRIRDSIRTHVRSAALIASSLILGFLVSIFELGCTGQIYLPTITAMVRVGKEFWGFIFLFIYCLGFIIPLVAVFILTYRGISSKRLLDVFQQKMGLVKLILAGLFLGLAILTLLIY